MHSIEPRPDDKRVGDLEQDTPDVIRIDIAEQADRARPGESDVPTQGQGGSHDHSRTVRAVFPDATDGYVAVGDLRAAGFLIDLTGSSDGDLIVSIQAPRTRFDELATLVSENRGRIEPQPPT